MPEEVITRQRRVFRPDRRRRGRRLSKRFIRLGCMSPLAPIHSHTHAEAFYHLCHDTGTYARKFHLFHEAFFSIPKTSVLIGRGASEKPGRHIPFPTKMCVTGFNTVAGISRTSGWGHTTGHSFPRTTESTDGQEGVNDSSIRTLSCRAEHLEISKKGWCARHRVH